MVTSILNSTTFIIMFLAYSIGFVFSYLAINEPKYDGICINITHVVDDSSCFGICIECYANVSSYPECSNMLQLKREGDCVHSEKYVHTGLSYSSCPCENYVRHNKCAIVCNKRIMITFHIDVYDFVNKSIVETINVTKYCDQNVKSCLAENDQKQWNCHYAADFKTGKKYVAELDSYHESRVVFNRLLFGIFIGSYCAIVSMINIMTA